MTAREIRELALDGLSGLLLLPGLAILMAGTFLLGKKLDLSRLDDDSLLLCLFLTFVVYLFIGVAL